MADIYSLQQAAGTVHRELSFDVDGRFAAYEGVRAEEVDGVLHLVVVLSTRPDAAEHEGESSDTAADGAPVGLDPSVPDVAGGDI